MAGSSPHVAVGARVLVPVARPASLDSLLPIAAAMAAVDDGHVVPVTVVPRHAPEDVVRAAADLAVEAEARLVAEGLSASGVVAEARSIPAGVRSLVASERATLVVMGWRGLVDASRAFDATVDDVLGRSSVPLLVVRPADLPPARVVVPLGPGHTVPHGRGGLRLAATLAERLAAARNLGVSLLWAGEEEPDLPDVVRGLSDRVHHDPRRLDLAVGQVRGVVGEEEPRHADDHRQVVVVEALQELERPVLDEVGQHPAGGAREARNAEGELEHPVVEGLGRIGGGRGHRDSRGRGSALGPAYVAGNGTHRRKDTRESGRARPSAARVAW